jgi:hypothetical protein
MIEAKIYKEIEKYKIDDVGITASHLMAISKLKEEVLKTKLAKAYAKVDVLEKNIELNYKARKMLDGVNDYAMDLLVKDSGSLEKALFKEKLLVLIYQKALEVIEDELKTSD